MLLFGILQRHNVRDAGEALEAVWRGLQCLGHLAMTACSGQSLCVTSTVLGAELSMLLWGFSQKNSQATAEPLLLNVLELFLLVRESQHLRYCACFSFSSPYCYCDGSVITESRTLFLWHKEKCPSSLANPWNWLVKTALSCLGS